MARYLFNISEAYAVEAESEEQARDLLDNNPKKYYAGWREVTLVEEGESK